MKMKQLLSLLLLGSLAAPMYAMEQKTIEEIMRERAKKMEKQLEEQRAQEAAQTEKEAVQTEDAQEEQEIQTPIANNNNNNNIDEQNDIQKEPVIEEQSVIQVPHQVAKDKEEDENDLPVREVDLVAQRNQYLTTNLEGLKAFNNLQIRKHQKEGILAREYADILSNPESRKLINQQLEHCTANRQNITDRHEEDVEFDVEFKVISNAIDTRIEILQKQLELLEHNTNQQLWDELDKIFDLNIIIFFDLSVEFAQTLQAEREAYNQAQRMILEGHQPSGLPIVEDFTQIDRAKSDELIAKIIEQEGLDQATQDDATFAAQMSQQILDAQRQEEIDRSEAEARRLHQELNRENHNTQRPPVTPAPSPNDPDDSDSSSDEDNASFGNNGNRQPHIATPRPQQNQNPNNTPPARSLNNIDIPSFWGNQSLLMKTAIAAIGGSVIGYLLYEFYNWMNQEDVKKNTKKKIHAKTKSWFKRRVPAKKARSKFVHRRHR